MAKTHRRATRVTPSRPPRKPLQKTPENARAAASRRKLFVAEYCKDHHGTRAATVAGYSPKSAANAATNLLNEPGVQKAIAAQEAKMLARAELRAQDVLEVIRRHVLRDPGKFLDEQGNLLPLHRLGPEERTLIRDITANAKGGVTYTLQPQTRYVEMAAKHFTLLTERVEVVDHHQVIEKLNGARARLLAARAKATKTKPTKKR